MLPHKTYQQAIINSSFSNMAGQQSDQPIVSRCSDVDTAWSLGRSNGTVEVFGGSMINENAKGEDEVD